MDYKEMSINERLEAAKLLESLRVARQAAFEARKLVADFNDYYDRIESLYSALAADLGTKAKPPFDADAHIEDRLQAGDDAYTAALAGKR